MFLSQLINSFNFKKLSKASKTDFGVLKVAFMVAALDGEISESEYKEFEALAKKCCGYTPELAAIALDEAMRSAGYLMILGKRVNDAELVTAFIKEAQSALPEGFAYLSIEDVRRAIITWIAMGMSDGDYSSREKMCIEALRKHFAELKISRIAADEERWIALSPAFRQACGVDVRNTDIKLVSQDFVSRVEKLISRYGDSADVTKELKQMIEAE